MKYIKTYESISDLIEFQKSIGKYVIFLFNIGAGKTKIFLCRPNELFICNMKGDNIYYLNGKMFHAPLWWKKKGQTSEKEKETWYDFQNLNITDWTFIKSFTDVEVAKSEYLSMVEAEKYNL